MTIRAYRYQVLSLDAETHWVKAESRAKARRIVAYALDDAGWYPVGKAFAKITGVRLDPRADDAPVCGEGPGGLVHAGWKPEGEG